MAYMPRSPLMRAQNPRGGLGSAVPQYGMRADAARMAAEGDQAKAPIIPATNMRLQKQAPPPTMSQPQGMSLRPEPEVKDPRSQLQPAGPVSGQQAPPTPGTLTGAQSALVPGGVFKDQATVSQGTKGTPVPGAGGGMGGSVAGQYGAQIAGQDKAAKDAAQAMVERDAQGSQRALEARLGASGFGTSGLMGALSGNIRADAARELAQQFSTIDRQSRDDIRADRGLNEQVRQNDINNGRADAAMEAALAAAAAEAGFIDMNNDNKDDASGLSLDGTVASNRVTGGKHRNLGDHVFDTMGPLSIPYAGLKPGSQENPLLLSEEEFNLISAHWRQVGKTGNNDAVYVGPDGQHYTYIPGARF